MEKFPDHIDTTPMAMPAAPNRLDVASPAKQTATAFAAGASMRPLAAQDRWRPLANGDHASHSSSRAASGSSSPSPSRVAGHHRQKSISEAFKTIRTRQGSISQNAHEIADALRAPMSPTLVILCILWYMSSALTNTSSKSILNAFDKPATLTLVQFALVSSYCVVSAWVAAAFPVLRTTVAALRYPIRRPSRQVLSTALPLAVFQIAGHLLSSTATAKIPVSLVHTIKGLSPLFTVLAYRLVYDIHYPTATYLSLIPLTCGVMLACSGKHGFGGELLGIIYALLAAIVFVTQNIFSKRLFNEAAQAEKQQQQNAAGAGAGEPRKLDKLNLLCYSSGLAFLMTLPIWFWSEGVGITRDLLRNGTVTLKDGPDALDHGRLLVEFLFNGTFHWGQNILAFVLLSMVSPVTYSVASLIKRVWVIVLAIIWFRSQTTPLQAVGIGLTFVGLYLYDRSSESNKADRRARTMSELQPQRGPVLPVAASSRTPPRDENGTIHIRGGSSSGGSGSGSDSVFASPILDDNMKKCDDAGRSQSGSQTMAWLPPGTRQEETWWPVERQAIGV